MAVPVAVSACKRAETPPSPPPAVAPAPAPTPPPAPAPFRVSSVDVGNAIGADKRVTAPSTTIAPTGPANSEFPIAKPDGTYKVEILADGTSVASKEFEAK